MLNLNKLNEQRTVAIIQARMGSSRLPGKSLMDLAGRPLLERVIQQVKGSKFLDDVIVATSTQSEDDAIEKFCSSNNFKVFRGAKDDVLSRYLGAALFARAEIILRITGDCPLQSPDTIDEILKSLPACLILKRIVASPVAFVAPFSS